MTAQNLTVTTVDSSYVDNTPSGLSAEVEALLSFRVDFTVMAQILAQANGEQQAEFFSNWARHMKQACGQRVDFQWASIANELGDDDRYLLRDFMAYLSSGEG